MPNTFPLPKNSRALPKIVSAMANPSPMPTPSIIDERTLFFEANASALPKTMQFTTIKGMNKPRLWYNEGR